ncbi:MAG: hypothetical protein WC856_26130 [Methylococcaceae bacterium]
MATPEVESHRGEITKPDRCHSLLAGALTASMLYNQLGIEQSFKDWVTQQPCFADFKPFFGTLQDGKFGKDYISIRPSNVS